METINEGFLKDLFAKDLEPKQKEKVKSSIEAGVAVKNRYSPSLEALRARHQTAMKQAMNKNQNDYVQANLKNRKLKTK